VTTILVPGLPEVYGLSARSALRILECLQPAFFCVPLWKEKLAGGCDPRGEGPSWAEQGFILEEE